MASEATTTKRCFVSTSDNPFDYFTQFEDWYRFDVDNGYNTCAYVARMVHTSNELSDEDVNVAVKDAVDRICELNLTGNYIRVTE